MNYAGCKQCRSLNFLKEVERIEESDDENNKPTSNKNETREVVSFKRK